MDRILAVATALVTTCLVLSMIASRVQEFIASHRGHRAETLRKAIQSMLGDQNLTDAFFGHPLVQSMSFMSADALLRKRYRYCLPQYIPADTFRKVLLSMLSQGYSAGATSLTDILPGMPDSALRRSLRAIAAGAGEAELIAGIELWYNETMDQVSGLYKLNSQKTLLILGLALAVAVNANPIRISKTFWSSAAARDQTTTLAAQFHSTQQVCAANTTAKDKSVDDPCNSWAILQNDLKALPVGWTSDDEAALFKAFHFKQWDHVQPKHDAFMQLLSLLFMVFGWLLMAVAVSFGAPFWFDVLNQITNLRISGPKPNVSAASSAPVKA